MGKLGMLVFATDTGLGRQTEILYRMLKPAKTMLVDLSKFNGMPVHEDWYNFDIRTSGFPTDAEIDQFLTGIDVVFFCETPLNYYLISQARELGIKTILQENPEFLDYFRPDGFAYPKPDVVAMPSAWMAFDVKQAVQPAEVTYLPVPVDNTKLPKRDVTQAKTFFHIAGRPAAGDRNGTLDFYAAAEMAWALEPGMRFVIYCQQPTEEIRAATTLGHVELVEHLDDYADLYRDGDVLVLPRRYGGLCLPAQEAIACGIPVLMPSIQPNTSWMPSEWLTDVSTRKKIRTRTEIDVFNTNVTALAQKMLDLYRDPQVVENMGKQARELAKTLTMDVLEPQYQRVIHGDS